MTNNYLEEKRSYNQRTNKYNKKTYCPVLNKNFFAKNEARKFYNVISEAIEYIKNIDSNILKNYNPNK